MARHKNVFVSAGLDSQIYLWDVENMKRPIYDFAKGEKIWGAYSWHVVMDYVRWQSDIDNGNRICREQREHWFLVLHIN